MNQTNLLRKTIAFEPAPQQPSCGRRSPQPAESRAVVAELMWGRLSPGSQFHRSRVGRHLSLEHLLVEVNERSFYVSVAYLTGDRGENTEAMVHRQLLRRPPLWEPQQIRKWEHPVCSEAFYPGALTRALPLLVSYTRDFVQYEARRGWNIDRWIREGDTFTLDAA